LREKRHVALTRRIASAAQPAHGPTAD
jgi:hypothetical protein